MAFWGVEVKPGKPYSLQSDTTGRRLHISKATLGVGKSAKKSLVQCTVGDKSPVLICCLKPDQTDSCSLHIEFAEYEEVVLSVLGDRSVHLAGHYLDRGSNFDDDDDDDDFDSYGEDIGETESEQSTDIDTGDEYEGDFIDDDSEDDDMGVFPPSPRPNSGVIIEEILDDVQLAKANGDSEHPKKKFQVIDSDGENHKQIIVGSASNNFESESEDEDGFPISPQSKPTDESAEVQQKSGKQASKKSKKKVEGGDQMTGAKRKSQDNRDDETERGVEKPCESSLPSSEVGQENADKPKKKKRKARSKEAETSNVGDDSMIDVIKEDKGQMEDTKTDDKIQAEPVTDEAGEKLSDEKSVEIDANHGTDEDTIAKKKKKKKKKNKTPESEIIDAKKGLVVENEDEKAEAKPTQERSYPNGLVVQELQMGKPDGKRASPGNKVSVHYIGKLKKNGKIFDSNIRNCNAPFQFRLGVGQVIKGWDVGVNGMRVGDKRRLTIPPSMGYGSKGVGQIPPNAWLVFDIELVAVR